MKILHYGSLAAETGGPAYSTYLSIKGVRELGEECSIVMPPLTPEEHLLANDVPIIYAGFDKLKQELSKNPADVYHVQGIWSPAGHMVCSFARRTGKPYVIALRGMLYPQALAKKAWKKRLAMLLYQAKDLRHAACIQTTCEEERTFYRKLGFKNPAAVIPNAIELPEKLMEPPIKNGIFHIGYLGRLHPRKNVERLIYAMIQPEMQKIAAELLIIGGGDRDYEAFLRKEVQRLKLSSVKFAGFLQGEEKNAALKSLSVLAVPSDFENFGNIVVEALKEGVPVIASQGMPWQELETQHCGWWRLNDVKSITDALLEAAKSTPAELRQMGINGQELLRMKYSLPEVAKKLLATYQWVQTGANPQTAPDFIEC